MDVLVNNAAAFPADTALSADEGSSPPLPEPFSCTALEDCPYASREPVQYVDPSIVAVPGFWAKSYDLRLTESINLLLNRRPGKMVSYGSCQSGSANAVCTASQPLHDS